MKPKPCRKCGGIDLKIHHCGYTTFNPGYVECNECGHKVKVSCCKLGDEENDLIKNWNNEKISDKEKVEILKVTIKKALEKKRNMSKILEEGLKEAKIVL